MEKQKVPGQEPPFLCGEPRVGLEHTQSQPARGHLLLVYYDFVCKEALKPFAKARLNIS